MKVRLAVVGSGFGLYGLLPAFQQIPDCTVVGLSGQPTERLLAYCRQTAVPHFPHWREMIEQTRPDALAVAVVPRHQYEIVKFALEQGIAVFAEKPLAHDLAAARELLALAQTTQRAHMVDFLYPEIPAWRRTRELLAQDAIGRVLQVTVNWNFLSHDLRHKINSWKTDPAAGGGALAFYFSHAFYNLEFLLGRIETLYCQLNHSPASLGGGETVVNLLAGLANGGTANIALNCGVFSGNRQRWEFHGTGGALVLENSTAAWACGFELVRFNDAGQQATEPFPEMPVAPALDERVGLVKSVGERFVNWCANRTPARPDFTDGVRVQELIAAARDAFQHGKIVKV
jgi:predicted dehydrogenase